MALFGMLLHGVLVVLLALLTLRAVLGLVPLFARDWEPKGGLRVLAEFVLTVTDPPVRLVQRFVPPLRLGGVQVDLAFTLVYVGVALLLRWL